MLIAICFAYGCDVVTEEKAMEIVKSEYPNAILMSCPACGGMVPWVNVFFRTFNDSDEKCDIRQIDIDAPTKRLIADKGIARDSIESCASDKIFLENNEVQNKLADCRDIYDRIKDGIACY